MRVRTFIVSAFITFLLITLVLLWFETPSIFTTSTAQTPSAPMSTATATPTHTPTPTIGEKITQAEKSLFDPIVATLNYAVAILVAVLVLFLIWRVWYLSGLSNLVVDTFTNATGDDELSKVLPGLNQITREYLVQVLKWYRDIINESKDQGLDTLNPFPPPEYTSDQQLTNLLNSLKDAVDGGIKVAVQLLNLVFTPRGTKVLTTLQSIGDTPARLGISLQVIDLEGNQEPVLYTVWEQNPIPVDEGDESLQAIASGNRSPQVNSLSPSATTTPFIQRAESYYNLAVLLDTLGMYEDAINFLEEALKCDKTLQKAAQALAASLSHLQAQKSAISSYIVGKQLQEAGLLLPAIESYKKPLPAIDQTNAEIAWKNVLKLTEGNEATSYFTLAKLYKQDGLYLFDQSLDLYKAAIAKGSKDAARELEDMQKAEAAKLTEIGSILAGLTQYNASEKYLMTALAKVPGHSEAQAVLAMVRQSKSPQENKDALAFYSLGRLYEERGAKDAAKGQYVDALTKQPDYDEARVSLQRVLASRKTLEQRFVDLMWPAGYWLAIELAQRAMKRDAKSLSNRIRRNIIEANEQHVNYQSRLYNFIGYLHQSEAQKFAKEQDFHNLAADFYNLAINDFKQAISLDGKWFQPFENLALTYAMLLLGVAKQELPLPDQQTVDLLYSALTNYDKAEHLFQQYKDEQSISPEKALEVERRIKIGKYTVLLLSNDRVLIEKSINEIERMRKGWKLNSEESSRLSYNLACWYGLTDDLAEAQKVTIVDTLPSNEKSEIMDVENIKQATRRYVVYSVIREQTLLYAATLDPCFASIANDEGWKQLNAALLNELYEYPDLPKAVGQPFDDVVTKIVSKIKWL